MKYNKWEKKGLILIALLLSVFISNSVFAQNFIIDNDDIQTENSNIFTLDSDNSGGDVTLQFGASLNKLLTWDNANSYFSLNDDLNLAGNELQDFDLENLATAPTCDSTASGRMYHNTTDSNTYVCDGVAWLQIDSNIEDLNGTNFNNFILDLDDTGGDVKLQFGTALNKALLWDNTNSYFSFNDDLNLLGNELQNFNIENLSSAPTCDGTANGRLYHNTVDTFTYVCDGTSWLRIDNGLSPDLLAALEGTFGIPSATNKFVTDNDPRLNATAGFFGETSLGDRLSYQNTSFVIDKKFIFYSRIFLPADTTVNDIGLFTTESKTTNINMGLYSDNNGPDIKLTEVGTQSSVSTANFGFNTYSLVTPYITSDAGFYWIAVAVGPGMPKAATYINADDRFIPYRVESKPSANTTLPATANPDAVGHVVQLPYFAAFE